MHVLVGLTFAGGGASGGAHIGVLQALTEGGIHPEIVSGTSSGAMVAGLYAADNSIEDMLSTLPKLNRRYLDPDTSLLTFWTKRERKGGLLRGDRLEHFIFEKTKGIALRDVKKPLAIVATDMQNGREIVFSSRPCPSPSIQALNERAIALWDTEEDITLARAIRASISIPLVFQPVMFNQRILADGGLIDNCPVEPARALGADFVIASDTITPFLRLPSRLSLRPRHLFQQMVNIGLARHAALSSRTADIFLTPPVGPIGALQFDRLTAVAEAGYAYTKERMDTILRILDEKQRKERL